MRVAPIAGNKVNTQNKMQVQNAPMFQAVNVKNNLPKINSSSVKDFMSAFGKAVGIVTAAFGALTSVALGTYSYRAMDKRGEINYVEPLRTEFATRRDAINYATNWITLPLMSSKPYEYAVFIDNESNEILAEFKGDESHVMTGLSLADEIKVGFRGSGVTLLHGHPTYENGVTPPISFSDFCTLTSLDYITELVAMDKKGNVSGLRKTPDYKPISDEQRIEIYNDYHKILIQAAQQEEPGRISELKTEINATDDKIKQDSIYRVYEDLLFSFESSRIANKLWHNYWHANASKLGLEYYTNFDIAK